MSEVLAISSLPDEDRFAAYRDLALKYILASDAGSLSQLLTHLMTTEASTPFGRNYIVNDLLALICSKIKDADEELESNIELDDAVSVLLPVVSFLRPRADDFPEAHFAATDVLSAAYQGLERWVLAAETKASYPMAAMASKLSISPVEQLEWHIDVASFYLKPPATSSSIAYTTIVQRATPLVSSLFPSDVLMAVAPIPSARVATTRLPAPGSASSTAAAAAAAAAEAAAATPAGRAHAARLFRALFRYSAAYARAAEAVGRYLDSAGKYLLVAAACACPDAEPAAGMTDKAARAALLSASFCLLACDPSPQRARLCAAVLTDPRAADLPTRPLVKALAEGGLVGEEAVSAAESHPGCPAALRAAAGGACACASACACTGAGAGADAGAGAGVGAGVGVDMGDSVKGPCCTRSALRLALTDHNLSSCTRLFTSASFDLLASLSLGATAAEARARVLALAARGVTVGRVDDQGRRVIFDAAAAPAVGGAARGGATGTSGSVLASAALSTAISGSGSGSGTNTGAGAGAGAGTGAGAGAGVGAGTSAGAGEGAGAGAFVGVGAGAGAGATSGQAPVLEQWGARVREVCTEAADVAEEIMALRARKQARAQARAQTHGAVAGAGVPMT